MRLSLHIDSLVQDVEEPWTGRYFAHKKVTRSHYVKSSWVYFNVQ